MSADHNYVDSMVDYTRYQAECEEQGFVSLSYAVYSQNFKLFLSQTLVFPPRASNQAVASTSGRKRNIENFLASQDQSHNNRVNCLPAKMSDRASMRDKALRGARTTSAKQMSPLPVQNVTINPYLYGGPNWSEAKATETERANIKQFYNSSRQLKLAVTLNALDTAKKIRSAYSDVGLKESSEFTMMCCRGNSKSLKHFDFDADVMYVDVSRLKRSFGIVHLIPKEYLKVTHKDKDKSWCPYCFEVDADHSLDECDRAPQEDQSKESFDYQELDQDDAEDEDKTSENGNCDRKFEEMPQSNEEPGEKVTMEEDAEVEDTFSEAKTFDMQLEEMLQTNGEPGEKVKMEDDECFGENKTNDYADGTEDWLEDVIPPLLSSTSSATSPGATTTSLVPLVRLEQRRRSCLLAAELRQQLNNTDCEEIKGNQKRCVLVHLTESTCSKNGRRESVCFSGRLRAISDSPVTLYIKTLVIITQNDTL
jgi:hypothetical protein